MFFWFSVWNWSCLKTSLEIEMFFRNSEINLWVAVNYIFRNELNIITKSGFRSQYILNCHPFFIMLHVFQDLKCFNLKKRKSPARSKWLVKTTNTCLFVFSIPGTSWTATYVRFSREPSPRTPTCATCESCVLQCSRTLWLNTSFESQLFVPRDLYY